MSGPKSYEYVLVSSVLDVAWGAYQEQRQRRHEEAYREQAQADQRAQERREAAQRREEERRAREEAKQRLERAAELMQQARGHERRLERAQGLAEEAHRRFPNAKLDRPPMPALPGDTGDPAAIERYIEAVRSTVHRIEASLREHAAQAANQQGLQELMAALASTVAPEPRTAADLLDVYAAQVRALARPAAARVLDRRATAERILGRLVDLADGAVPAELDALMRNLIEAESEDRAELLALELRAQVQSYNAAREHAERVETKNRKREIAGVLVAEVLSDLGYEVEPITETLFVSGGVAHFQRAEWGDYYVRMRVDSATSQVNFNMVRTAVSSDPPDAAQRRRDEETESAWCAGLPKLLTEMAARGIDARQVRALDAGAVPVQVVKPETVVAALRKKSEPSDARTAPREMARPLNK